MNVKQKTKISMDIADIVGENPLYLRVRGDLSFDENEARLFLAWCEKYNKAYREEVVSKDKYRELKQKFLSCYETGI